MPPVSQLCDLYENDCIFDKFDACMSPDGSAIATGTYSNNFKVKLGWIWARTPDPNCLMPTCHVVMTENWSVASHHDAS